MSSKAKRNRLYEPLIMVAAVVAVLALLSYSDSRIQLGDFQSRPVQLFSEVTEKGTLADITQFNVLITDSVLAKDSVLYAEHKKQGSSIVSDVSDSAGSGLFHFFQSLKETLSKKKKTRIAYFGDSMIEGDLITQDLRELLQEQFGGSGVGFVPVTSIVANFRQTIRHTFSGWQTFSMVDNASDQSIGITGYSFLAANDSAAGHPFVEFTPGKTKRQSAFEDVRLFYGPAAEGSYLMLNKAEKHLLKGQQLVNELVITKEKPLKQVNSVFFPSTPLMVHGYSFESPHGVFVDNFSFRGNSGIALTKMSSSILKAMDSYLHYDLIILQYGLNVANAKMTDYSWYEAGMLNVIHHLQQCFPHASFLIISVGDKGYKQEEGFVTDPSIPVLVETQRNLARKTNAAFWNLYNAMGGAGSMVKWVEGDTVLANKDYAHLNFKGARKVGKMLYEKLMEEFDAFEKRQFQMEKKQTTHPIH